MDLNISVSDATNWLDGGKPDLYIRSPLLARAGQPPVSSLQQRSAITT